MCTCVLRPVTYLFSVALRKLCGDAPNVVTQINALQYQVCIRKKKLLGCQHATKVKIYIYIYIYKNEWMQKRLFETDNFASAFLSQKTTESTHIFPKTFPLINFIWQKKICFALSSQSLHTRGKHLPSTSWREDWFVDFSADWWVILARSELQGTQKFPTLIWLNISIKLAKSRVRIHFRLRSRHATETHSSFDQQNQCDPNQQLRWQF